MSEPEFYFVGLKRTGAQPLPLTGPLPRDRAEAWINGASQELVMLPWSQTPSAEDHDMADMLLKRATYEDVLNAPPGFRAEILEGRLVLMPRPASLHLYAASALNGLLWPPFHEGTGGPGGWIILPEPEIHFGKEPDLELADPDLAGWRIEHMPQLPDIAHFTLIPDWICEVISPSSEKNDTVIKPRLYQSFGLAYYWIVDPREHTLETRVLKDNVLEHAETFRDADIVAAPPFHDVPFNLDKLWPK